MAEYVELYMDQGADFSTTININVEDNNLPQNLEGFIVTSQLRKSLISINATANLVCTIINPLDGEIIIELDSANTANIYPGRYVYDVYVTNGNARVRVLEGIINVTPQVTKLTGML